MEHWLPLLEERLATVFDYVGDDCIILQDAAGPAAAEAQFTSIADYHRNRVEADKANLSSYRPLPPEMLYLTPE